MRFVLFFGIDEDKSGQFRSRCDYMIVVLRNRLFRVHYWILTAIMVKNWKLELLTYMMMMKYNRDLFKEIPLCEKKCCFFSYFIKYSNTFLDFQVGKL